VLPTEVIERYEDGLHRNVVRQALAVGVSEPSVAAVAHAEREIDIVRAYRIWCRAQEGSAAFRARPAQ
jgi:hypothetical protein